MAIFHSGCCACKYAALSARTIVLPEPARPRIRWTPSTVSMTARPCALSRFATESSKDCSLAPLENVLVTSRFFFPFRIEETD